MIPQDKPISLSVRQYLIRKLSVKMMVDEKIIDAIVDHQFKALNKAMVNNLSIEMSGFGKYYFNMTKAKKDIIRTEITIEKYKAMLPSLEKEKQARILGKLEGLEEVMVYLKRKTCQ